MRWIKFRSLLENSYSRKIYGFDTFGTFPDASIEDDIVYIQLTNLNIRKNMDLVGSSLYEYAKDGRGNRIEDLTNAIKYLSSNIDSVSRIKIKVQRNRFFGRA